MYEMHKGADVSAAPLCRKQGRTLRHCSGCCVAPLRRPAARSEARSALRLGGEPGESRQPLGFEFADLVGLFERETDVIEPVQQTVLAEGIDLERMRGAIGFDDLLSLAVAFKLITGCRLNSGEQRRQIGRAH